MSSERKQLQPVPRPNINGAPVTAALLVTGIVTTLLIYGVGLRHWDTELLLPPGLQSPVPAVLRLFFWLFAFRYPGEAIFGGLMLYYFQFLEKQMGTRKFLPFVVFATVVQESLQLLYARVLRELPLTKSGMYGIVFASMAMQQYLAPAVKQRLVGFSLTQKQATLMMGFFLVLNEFLFDRLFNHEPDLYLFGRSRFSVSGLVAAVFGYVAGVLYLLPRLGPPERWMILPSSRNPLVVWMTLAAHKELETVPYHLRPEHMRLLAAAYNPANW
jgi:membrane associated rhomboid family serine protease